MDTIDIINEFVKSPEMREHLKKAPLTLWELAILIINAPESLEKKTEALKQLLSECADKDVAALLFGYILEIQDALDALAAGPGEVFNLIECWYDNETLCEKESTGTLFASFEAALTYLRKLIAEEEWNDNTTCWTIIEKWIPAESGQMKKTYEYILIKDAIVDFRNYDTDTNVLVGGVPLRISSRNPLDVHLNLPIPFKPGDIVALNCRPFAPVKPALLLEVGDDCCGVQMFYEKDGPLNMDIFKTAALKHGHGFVDLWGHEYIHPLSYLYNLRPYPVPDDYVFENKEWEDLQFNTALPQMRKALSDHHFKDKFEVDDNMLRKYYEALCHCKDNQYAY